MPVLNSESVSDRESREGNGVLDRLVSLDDYWTIASAQPPVLLGDPLAYDQRCDQIAASLVDFPLSMVSTFFPKKFYPLICNRSLSNTRSTRATLMHR
jgi:hypothetical protein